MGADDDPVPPDYCPVWAYVRPGHLLPCHHPVVDGRVTQTATAERRFLSCARCVCVSVRVGAVCDVRVRPAVNIAKEHI